MEKRIYYLSNTVIPNTKRNKNIHVFNVLTQVGVKQLTDFLRTVTAASDLVDCTLVNCELTKLYRFPQMGSHSADVVGARGGGGGGQRPEQLLMIHLFSYLIYLSN